MFSILRPYIFSLDPEVAHDLAIKSLKFNILPKIGITGLNPHCESNFHKSEEKEVIIPAIKYLSKKSSSK